MAPQKIADADTFVIWGCETLKRCGANAPIIIGDKGLDVPSFGPRPSFPAATSWAAPIALARAVWEREVRFPSQPMSNDLVAKIVAAMTPSTCGTDRNARCAFQDVFGNHQFEYFRLGYDQK